MRAALTLGVFICAATSIDAQTPTRDQARISFDGSASVSGTVVADDEAKPPLQNAIVTLSRNGVEDIRSTPTDAQGRFVFERLPAGSYALGAGKGGYISMNYGAPKPGMPGRAVTVGEGQTFTASAIALMRGAVIAGRIVDSSGRPVVTTVEAVQFAITNGERRRRNTTGAVASGITNAHGEFRIHGLLPGEYLVSVNPAVTAASPVSAAELLWAERGGAPPPQPRSHGFSHTYFPGSAVEAAAVSIRLGPGEERLGLDFSPQLVPVSHISGFVRSSVGRPVQDINVLAVPKRRGMALGMGIRLLFTRTAADGAFTIEQIPPGEYVISVKTSSTPSNPTVGAPQWGAVDVSVTGTDVVGVEVRLSELVSVSGRLMTSSAVGPPPNADMVTVRLISTGSEVFRATAGDPSAPVRPDGTFTVSNVMPGSYRVGAVVSPGRSPVNFLVRSAIYDGADRADLPFDVGSSNATGLVLTIADNLPELTGTLLDLDNRPVPQLYVFAFSTDSSYWAEGSRRIVSIRATESGTYRLAGLPPGEYFLCALTELDTVLQFETEFLTQLIPAAIKITLADGEKKAQNLRIGR